MPDQQKKSEKENPARAEAPEVPAEKPDELTQLKGIVLNLAKTVAEAQAKTDARIDELAHSLEAGQPSKQAAPAPKAAPLTTLPEGTVRFRTTHNDFRVRRKAGKKVVIDNEVVKTDDVWISFSHGIYDASDPEEIEFLRNRPYFNKTLFEDPSAQPRRGVRVVDGPRSSGQSRPSPNAPHALAVKLSGEARDSRGHHGPRA